MQTTWSQRVLVVSMVLGLAACGGDSAGDGVVGDDGPTVDTVAPALLSSTPTNDEAGVPASAVIELVFSEPMDRASVEGALATSPFDPGDAQLSWNAAGDTLTITPLGPLARGAGVGVDPSLVQPIAHRVTIGRSATDLAGNPLDADVVVGFTTEVLMTLTIPPDAALSRLMRNDGVTGKEGINLFIGDGATPDLYTRALLSFDLGALPPSATGIVAASLRARQLAVVGTPYADLGALLAYHVSYTTMDASAFDAAPLLAMGTMSSDGTLETKSVDATAAVQDDFAQLVARDGRSQFRLQFATSADNGGDNDIAQFDYATIGLVVTYTAP